MGAGALFIARKMPSPDATLFYIKIGLSILYGGLSIFAFRLFVRVYRSKRRVNNRLLLHALLCLALLGIYIAEKRR